MSTKKSNYFQEESGGTDQEDHLSSPKAKTPKPSVKLIPKINIGNPLSGIGSKIQQMSTGTKESIKAMLERDTNSDGTNIQSSKVIAVWNPTGYYKSFTALNLAISGKAALLNFDLTCPELDVWFGIKQTGIQDASEKDAGIMTWGDSLNPELLTKMLRTIKWGIRYLPAGNKLGNIGTPTCAKNAVDAKGLFKQLIDKARKESSVVVIDAGRDFELPPTYAALKEADIIVVPITTPQEGKLISWQLQELARVGVTTPTVELTFTDGLNKICQYRVETNIKLEDFLTSAAENIPHCTMETGQEWVKIMNFIKVCSRRGEGDNASNNEEGGVK
ncbi:MinD/ParA family ATP-binding protein [Desulfofalx alkaliphila]|uniref:MinD/ParA family ATP-binding protein n=1 Tax=Desulfofalx alkaliphila TaxID=105483 RepID=UPI0004E24400|nr:hypothetical protein [Desulfofalx alkaliphila]